MGKYQWGKQTESNFKAECTSINRRIQQFWHSNEMQSEKPQKIQYLYKNARLQSHRDTTKTTNIHGNWRSFFLVMMCGLNHIPSHVYRYDYVFKRKKETKALFTYFLPWIFFPLSHLILINWWLIPTKFSEIFDS